MPLPPGIRLAPGTQLDVRCEGWPTGWRRGVVTAAWFEGAGNRRGTVHRIRFEQLALRPDVVDQFEHDLSQVETRFPASAASEVFGVQELLSNIHDHLLSRDTQMFRQVNHQCAQAGSPALERERHLVAYTHSMGSHLSASQLASQDSRSASLAGVVYAPDIARHAISGRPQGEAEGRDHFGGYFGGRGSGPGHFIDPVGVVAYEGQLVVADMGNSRLQWFTRDRVHVRTIDLNFRPNALGISYGRVYVTSRNDDGSATMHVLTLAGLELRAIRLRVGGKVLAIQVNGGAHRDEIHVIRGDATLGAHSGGPCNCYEVFLRCGPLCPTLVRSVGALTALVMDTVAQAHESEGPVMR